MQTLLNKVIAASVSLGVALGSPAAPSTNPLPEIQAPVIAGVQKAPEIVTPLSALDKWIERLAKIESHNQGHLKILDSNGLHSYGCLQFQMQTFHSYVERYGLLPNAESAELENMIYDCSFQKLLAKKMIQEDRDNWQHWYTSVVDKELGYPPIDKELAKK